MAQWIRRKTTNLEIAGSSPAGDSILKKVLAKGPWIPTAAYVRAVTALSPREEGVLLGT